MRIKENTTTDIIAAVVTYNRLALLKECLQALLDNTSIDILVVDNASTDGTRDYLKELEKTQPRIHILLGKENLGGAGGFNLALKEAAKRNPEFIWMMDDDTIVNRNSLKALEEAVHQVPDGLFYSSRALWTDGTDNTMNAHRLLESEKGKQAVLCREATFVSLLVKTSALYKEGLPISDFFIWGDDIEYTRRLSFAARGYYVPGSTVLHKTANNAGSNIAIDSIERLNRYRYAYRNEVYMARKEGLKRELRQLAKICYHTARVLLVSPERKMDKIRLIWSASREGLSFNPEVEVLTQKEEESQ